MLLFAVLLFFAGAVSAQGQPRTFKVPFHNSGAMILLDASVNGNPAVLLLDTGSVRTMVSFEALGHNEVKAKPVKPSRLGAGADGQYLKGRSNIGLGDCTIFAQDVFAVDLSEVSKMLGTRVDGLLGADVLREFSAVRIDYKAHVIEFEQ